MDRLPGDSSAGGTSKHRVVYLFVLLCFLASIDLWRQYSLNSHTYWFYLYARGVQSRADFWEVGYHMEEMEHKLDSQRAYFESVDAVLHGFAPDLRGVQTLTGQIDDRFLKWRHARQQIQELLHNDSSIYQVECEKDGPLLRVGVNDFRTDERDVCNIMTSPSMDHAKQQNSVIGSPDTMFERVLTGVPNEFYLKSISSGRFLTVDQQPNGYEWKLVVGGPVAGAAEKFRLSDDGLLFSALVKGSFTCGSGRPVLGYSGPYNNFNALVFKEVDNERLTRAWELVDLSQQVEMVQKSYAQKHSATDRERRQNANAAVSSNARGYESDSVKIAVTVPMTSKGTEMASVADSPFFANLFDSFMHSVDWRSNRLVFGFYLGFDKADLMYDTGDAWSEMRSEFSKRAAYHMTEQLMDEAAIKDVLANRLSVSLMHFEHLEGAPTQVVSQLVLKAYSQGYDYFYQVNDDTTIVTENWAPAFIRALAGNPFIPNFGVTGPIDQNNDLIFTHAFVHRTHIEVFGHLFPPSFKNWWSDDWISTVYGSTHTFRHTDVQIMHNVESQKTSGSTRYEIDQGAQIRLVDELRRGHVQIDEWLRGKNLPRLPLPKICGYIPLVNDIVDAIRVDKAGFDHVANVDLLHHHSRSGP